MASNNKDLLYHIVYENQESGGRLVGHCVCRFLMELQLRCLWGPWPPVGLTGTGGPASEMAQRQGWDLRPLGLLERSHIVAAGSPLNKWSAEQGRSHSLFLCSSLGYYTPLLLRSAIGHTDRLWYSVGKLVQGLHQLAGIFGDVPGGSHHTMTTARGPISCNLLSVLTLEHSCLDLFSILYSLITFYF